MSLARTLERFPWKRALVGVGLALLGTACQSDKTYGYFSVKVTIADAPTPPAFLARIATCGVNVAGSDTDFAPLRCPQSALATLDIGSFEWSTASKGTVHFIVAMKDVAGNVLATGTSPDVAIVQNQTVNTSVVVNPIPAQLNPMTAPEPDGGADTAPTPDAAETPDVATADTGTADTSVGDTSATDGATD